MRRSLSVLLFFTIGLLAFPADTQAAAGRGAVSSEVMESLKSSRVADRDTAISLLGQDRSPLAGQLLEGLRRGRLFIDRDRDRLYLENDGYVLLWPPDGEDNHGEPVNLKKVGTNNRQRQTLEGLLSLSALNDPLAENRRKASAALIGSSIALPEEIINLLAAEDDRTVRDNLVRILALSSLKDSSASAAEKLAALDELSRLYTPAAQNDLTGLAASGDPVLSPAARKVLAFMEARAQHLALAETFFFGASLGSVLVLAAIGLAITFGVMGVINMAHGEMVMLGAYTVWFMQTLIPEYPGLALILSLPTAFLVSGAVGGIIELSVIKPLYQRPLETLLATFGISLILQQAVRKLISPMNVAVVTPTFMSGQWAVTPNFSLTQGRVIIILFCLAVFLAVYLVLQKTRLGLEVRAVTQNRSMARALGIQAPRADTLTFALGSGVAGLAGVAVSQLTNVGPNLGQDYIVDSFMVVVFGGVGNLWGTLSGGLIIGLCNKFLEPVNGAMLARITIMAGIIIFIQRRPKGLFPPRGRVAAV
ncbi:MAG: urea ABC transporter permease subunit UrtB [Deltaproteobacteria bacterium]|jgi:urea transport system permease protein|nr:urea ABC transporter permease subunit UrtB [Deltaproteobacteria bacterium]